MDFLEHPKTLQMFTHEILFLTKDKNYLEKLIKVFLFIIVIIIFNYIYSYLVVLGMAFK